jgi:hypothetical protein
VDELL